MPNQLYSSGYLKPKSPGRTTFDLSHERVLTCNMGQLIPVLSELAYPGDHFRISARCVVRFNPLIHPLMHRVTGTLHYFAVPLRLLYPKDFPDDTDSRIRPFSFEEAIMGGADGVDAGIDADFSNIRTFMRGISGGDLSQDPTPGVYSVAGQPSLDPFCSPGSLWDYFRFAPSKVVPDGAGGTKYVGIKLKNDSLDVNMVSGEAFPITAPWLAYHFIWWENYRDPFIKADPTAGYDPPFVSSYNSQKWTPLLTDFYATDADSHCHADEPFNPLAVSDIRRPKYRAYEKDYFTSAQLQAQRGPAGIVEVSGFGVLGQFYPAMITNGTDTEGLFAGALSAGTNPFVSVGLALDRATAGSLMGTGQINRTTSADGSFDMAAAVSTNAQSSGTYPSQIGVNIPNVSNQLGQFDINTLRIAYAMQHHSEVNQRFGNRFTDYIFGHFGVVVKDDRLQRPEYIGGLSFPVVFSEVLQTSASDPGASALGELGGHGMAVNGGSCASYYVPEHCVIMGLLNVQPNATYGQGLDRQWIKGSRYDFYTPDFAFIGEQGIFDLEIMAQSDYNANTLADSLLDTTDIFGFQGAFDHYRQRTSSYHGLMHSDLASWHLGRFFQNSPILNTDFITTTADDWDRAFAVTNEVADELVVTIGQQILATRPMPYVSVPHIDGMED